MILTASRLRTLFCVLMLKQALHYLLSVSLTCCCCCCTSILSDHSRVHCSGNPKGPGLWSHRQRGMCCKTTTYQSTHLKYDIYVSPNSYAGFTKVRTFDRSHSHTHRHRSAWISCLLASLIYCMYLFFLYFLLPLQRKRH